MKVSQRHLGCGDEEAATAVEGRLARGVVGGAMVSVAMVSVAPGGDPAHRKEVR